MAPPAPPTFSMITDCPSGMRMRSPMMRAAVSVEPPGGKGTISVMGLAGKVWPHAECAASTRAKSKPRMIRREFGGVEEDRTPDLRIANATLSQLSYHPSESRGFYRSAGRRAIIALPRPRIPMQISPPFGYKEVVPFLKTQKVRLLAPGEVPDFVQHGNAIPISLSEFQPVAHDYPIVFTATQGTPTFAPVAVLGLTSGANLFFRGHNCASGVDIPTYA